MMTTTPEAQRSDAIVLSEHITEPAIGRHAGEQMDARKIPHELVQLGDF